MKLGAAQIAAILEEMAALLEIRGENPFKVRAYQNAAGIVENMSDLEERLEKKTLTDVKGIGKNLADHITELATTGKLTEHIALRKTIPDGVLDMLAIPGVGAKRVAVLWKKLDLKTIDELHRACEDGRVASLPGFGEKSATKIVTGIENLRRYSGRHLINEAHAIAEALLSALSQHSAVVRLSLGGSIRRSGETVKDIDIVASSHDAEKLIASFVKLPLVEHIVAQGSTKASVVLASGMNADLRVVTDAEFPFALHYFTGSKAHNIAMRTIAKKHDMKLNEYGLFKENSKRSLVCKDEKDLFAKFGMPFIPPELREDMGEIEAAEKGTLPHLLEEKDLQGVVHVHTTFSDGKASVEEMARAAAALGFSYIGITDHSQSAAYAGGMKLEKVKQQWKEIDALKKKLKNIKILKGIEVDILTDGSLDYPDRLLAQFDFVIASIHSNFTMTEEAMTARICAALSNPHVDILAHPTGRLLLQREPYRVNLQAVIECAARHGKAIEINAHPRRLDLDWRHGPLARKMNVKTVITPDAHSVEGLSHMRLGVGMARKSWCEKKDVLNCLPADKFLQHWKGSS